MADGSIDGWKQGTTSVVDTPSLEGLEDLERFAAYFSGAIEITGRLKHQIDIAGAKVNPLEVEAAILECEGIRECVVLPCGVRGTLKRLRAVLVAESSASPPAVADLKAHLRSRLSAYKVPRIYEFRTELPRTPLGKIIRTESAS